MVVLLVDALGWELSCRSPELINALPHRQPLETILGFSSGALPTLFSGRMPSEHGRWLMYRRANGGTPFAGFGALRALPARLQRSWKLGRLLARAVAARGVAGYFQLYDVPRWLLSEFDLAERADIFAPGGLPVDSLWDGLARDGVSWRAWSWRTPEADALAALAGRLEHGEEDFLFCYTAELDATLHREGSSGAGVRRHLARYAAWLEGIAAAASHRGEELWIYLVSDHGMVDVRRSVDVMGALAGLEARWPRDYIPFFDSTMARFWWKRAGAREQVRGALERLGGGHWLDAAELEAAGAAFPGKDYGEDVFLLDPGVLMVPSFMGRSAPAAMHGYAASHPDMTALLASNRPIPAGVRHIRDVRAFLEAELAAAGHRARRGPEAA